jgi:hypothetical protein
VVAVSFSLAHAARRITRAADLLEHLAGWKESALAVEREWDANGIATMLGCKLGESQRACIQREVPRLLDQLRELEQRHPAPVPVAIPGEEYHEDMGAVTWWRFPVDEPPWVGTPNDSDWPGYHTHFTPAPPEPATALPLPSGEVQP